VVLLAGPSGAGKSRLASRLGLPVLSLDDYYRDADDPSLPRLATGLVDWDDPAAWDSEAARRGLRELAETGLADVPVYDISASRATGHRQVSLGGSRCFVAEGIFAAELVSACRKDGVLAEAICVRRSRWVTFGWRLVRDLREHRKSPGVLVRRGWWLARREPEIVAALVAKGCVPMTPREAERHIMELSAPQPTAPHTQA
jgi:uridine kinase